MSQHDYVIENASGPSVRADLNAVFQAIVSLNSGATAPSTTFAYMFWADTAAGLLKQRDGANATWITIGPLSNLVSMAQLLTAQGDLVYASSANTPARLAKGTAFKALLMNSGATAPEWGDSPQSVLIAAGDLLYASNANVMARLAKGAAYKALVMNSGGTFPEWGDSPQSILTAQGDILYASAANILARLAKGTSGQLLRMTATIPEWANIDTPVVPQTVFSALTDAHGFPDFLWNGQVDFAPLMPTTDAIQDSYTGSQYGYLAIDGSDSTYWQSGTAFGSSSGVAYLGVKNLKRNIKGVKYLNGAANAGVTSVKVQYSTDEGLTWTDIQTEAVNATASCWQEFDIAEYAAGAAGLHRFRLLANANPSAAAWTIYTLILLYNSNLDVCTTANAVSYDNNGQVPANAFDNAEGTYYSSNTNCNTGNHYLGQSGLASAVKAIRIKQEVAGTAPAREVRLSWKQNVGDAWTDLATVAIDDKMSPKGWQTIPVPSYSPSGSHYFAIRPTTNNNANQWQVYEVEFFTGIDDAVSMTASATDPLQLVHSSGINNYFTSITSAEASLVASLQAGRTHFFYAARNPSTGAITYGKTPVVPQYGKEFDVTKHCLLHFDGANGSTVIVDEYGGSTWVVGGNAQISTTTPKWGTGKLLLDGTGDSIRSADFKPNTGQPFTMEFQFATADKTIAAPSLLTTTASYPFALEFLYTGGVNKLSFYISSNGSGWDVASAVQSAPLTISNGTYYKCIIDWDGYYYRIFWGTQTSDMQCVVCVKSSSPIYTGTQYTWILGSANASAWCNGSFDEFRATIGSNRYGQVPTAETAAFDKYDADMHFFDINKMKMYYGGGASWTECQRVFLGEAYMDAHGITDMRNYALQGKYASLKKSYVAAANMAFTHNLGIVPGAGKTRTRLINKLYQNGWKPGEICDQHSHTSGGEIGAEANAYTRNLGVVGIGTAAITDRSGSGSVGITAANWDIMFVSERGW